VGRHIVRAFILVPEQGVTIGSQPLHKSFQITPHIRVGVLAQHERSAGVLHEHLTQALPNSGRTDDSLHLVGEILGAAAGGIDLKFLLENQGGK
jgi:hypothetical protein